MSFWGGFVEGFATTGKEEIDKDVARTDKIVDDTVKIGVNKALEMQDEIKKDKKKIRDELEMLTTQGFSLPKAASIVKAGMTSQMITLRNNTKNRLEPDRLWDGTTKFAQDNKLTIQDVVGKLSYREPLDFGNLKVGTPKGSLLGALGLAPEVDTRVQEGIMSRVGSLDTGVDRGDISILPGSIPLEAKKQFDTEKTMTTDQMLLKLFIDRNTKDGVLDKEGLRIDILRSKNPDLVRQFGLGNLMGSNNKNNIDAASIMPTLDELKNLNKKAEGGDTESRNLLKGYLENYGRIATKKEYDDLIKKLR